MTTNADRPVSAVESPKRVVVSRAARVPDELRLERYRKAPEFGPRVLFFSGGSALAAVSRQLVLYTHNSTHLITPLDSGGSSAVLRRAFEMPAVGDLRNRLMSVADQSVTGHPEVYELFATRLRKDATQRQLHAEFMSLADGSHELIKRVPDPLRKIIQNHINYLVSEMPADLDLRGASIGNLILTGGYLNNDRQLDPVSFLFSQLVGVRGTVSAITEQDVHLAAELDDGSVIIGQHALAGKQVPPIQSSVRKLFLIDNLEDARPVRVAIGDEIRKLIGEADLICYPMGSFYSSVIVHLLLNGVSQEISRNNCPKVYVPNTGYDPEQFGLTVNTCVQTLLRYLQQDAAKEAAPDRLINLVIVDSQKGQYPGQIDVEQIRELGIEVLDTPLITDRSTPDIDAEKLLPVLLSLT